MYSYRRPWCAAIPALALLALMAHGATIKFDQSQTGDYNLQIHLKNIELYAVFGDSGGGDDDVSTCTSTYTFDEILVLGFLRELMHRNRYMNVVWHNNRICDHCPFTLTKKRRFTCRWGYREATFPRWFLDSERSKRMYWSCIDVFLLWTVRVIKMFEFSCAIKRLEFVCGWYLSINYFFYNLSSWV